MDREDVESRILAANQEEDVDGIIVYYPIFNGRQDQYLQQIIDPSKDVEGLCHLYIFKLYHNERFLNDAQTQKSLLPCTPLAVIKILDHLKVYNSILPYGNRLFGRSITVINRSETVGRPLAALLANDGACVYSVDLDGVQQFTRGSGIKKRQHEVVEKTEWTVDNCLPLSDVVISAVPGESYKVPIGLLREGAVCINVSTEKVADPHPFQIIFLNENIQNFGAEVKEKASIYMPAIGKVTIVILFRNLLVSDLREKEVGICVDSFQRLVQNRESGDSM